MYEIKVENKNLIITDPCYLDNFMDGVKAKVKPDFWMKFCKISSDFDDCRENLKKFGFTDNICCDTLYGDWSCAVYQTEINPIEELKTVEDLNIFLAQENKRQIGSFCADAGLVCVVDADEIRKFNPDFFEWALFHKHCATAIYNFTGTIGIHDIDPHWEDMPNYRHRIVYGIADKEKDKYGRNFVSLQTGY